ncbi:MAG: GNAT family N-acetyltransferase [Acidobacteriota bacterium]
MLTISTDKTTLDVALIHRFLSEESYWAKNIPRPLVERSIENSLCFAAFDSESQVGFARVVTDRATFAYVGDVFVVSSHRGRGVSRLLLEAIRSHPDLQGLRRWHLLTRDAHALYEKFGFSPLGNPARHMEVSVPEIYSR